MEKEYKISESNLKTLIIQSKFLEALQELGVDNWEGFEYVEDDVYEVSEEDFKEFGAKEVKEPKDSE